MTFIFITSIRVKFIHSSPPWVVFSAQSVCNCVVLRECLHVRCWKAVLCLHRFTPTSTSAKNHRCANLTLAFLGRAWHCLTPQPFWKLSKEIFHFRYKAMNSHFWRISLLVYQDQVVDDLQGKSLCAAWINPLLHCCTV